MKIKTLLTGVLLVSLSFSCSRDAKIVYKDKDGDHSHDDSNDPYCFSIHGFTR